MSESNPDPAPAPAKPEKKDGGGMNKKLDQIADGVSQLLDRKEETPPPPPPPEPPNDETIEPQQPRGLREEMDDFFFGGK